MGNRQKEVLRLADAVKAEQSAWADVWVAKNVAEPFQEIAEGLVSQGMVAAKAVQELGGMLTIPRVRNLYNVRTLSDTISAQLSNLAMRILAQLESEAQEIYQTGITDSAEIAAAILVPETYRERFVTEALNHTPIDLDRPNQLTQGLTTKAHRLGPAIGEKMDYKFAQAMTLSQGALSDARIETIIEDVVGTGLMFLMGMFMLAIWNLYTGGSLFFAEIHEWISGWTWYSTLDTKTCPSCIWLHGQHFETGEAFYDHPSGRCIPVPYVNDWPWWIDLLILPPDIIGGDDITPLEVEQTGEDWFRSLPADVQEEILGHATYQAWINGAIRLEDLSAIHTHDVYGQIRLRASLRSILGDAAEEYYK